MQCEEEPDLKLKDGAKRILLNTKGVKKEGVSQELIDFLRFMEHSDAETALQSKSSKIRRIHEKVESIKRNEEVGIRYMNAWEEEVLARQEAKEEGIAEGKRENQLEIAKKMKTEGMDIKIISKITELAEDEIRSL